MILLTWSPITVLYKSYTNFVKLTSQSNLRLLVNGVQYNAEQLRLTVNLARLPDRLTAATASECETFSMTVPLTAMSISLTCCFMCIKWTDLLLPEAFYTPVRL